MTLTDLFLADKMLTLEFVDLLIGNFIGEGISRKVYECELSSDWVVKIADPTDGFNQNLTEWLVWDECETHKLEAAKWLAPIHYMSKGGHILIQERTTDIQQAQLPTRVPSFLNYDVKTANWGMLKGKVVCHDYGYSRALSRGITNRLVKTNLKAGVANDNTG